MKNQNNHQKVCLNLLDSLTERQKQIIARRFGLNNNQEEKETLQKIGDDFGITRERVRQIERDAIAKLRELKKPSSLQAIFVNFYQYFKENGGLKKEEIAIAELAEKETKNCVDFLFHLFPEFHYSPENDNFFAFWSIEKDIKGKLGDISKTLLNKFKETAQPLNRNELLNVLGQEPALAFSVIDVSKKIGQGPLGNFGLLDWPEINPKGVKDAAFLALLATSKPLHFREIAQKANEVAGDYFNGKIVLPQTVHNELIRDERFVLVGRGIYGLKDWGYAEGTVKEIIASVLRDSSSPLKREEILAKVKSQRIVKDNTVFLNLSDKKRFLKLSNGAYTVQES